MQLAKHQARMFDDVAIGVAAELVAAGAGFALETAQETLGEVLGQIASALIERHALRRLVVAGGDTSGRVIAQLPVGALEAVAPLARGSPIRRAYSDDPAFDGLELILKGGQVGGADLFVRAAGRTP